MKISLEGKNVLVTGASRGIGRAIAESMAGAGARIAVHFNSSEEKANRLAAGLGNGSETFCAGLDDPDSCAKLFDDVIAVFGHIDVLVNNAGIFLRSEIGDPDWTESWDRTMAVNLRAAGILCGKAIEHFKSRGGGRIINIASRAAYRGDSAEYLAYAASKGGLVSLSKSIARAFGGDGITCFVLAPGWVRTDMAGDSIREFGEDRVVGEMALNRITEPEDVASMATFLASGLADHATGTTIDINAGSYVR